jgi:thymidine phosphorylase
LEIGGLASEGAGAALAAAALDDGRAWRKFQAIATAQGGLRWPGVASQRYTVESDSAGIVTAIDSRRLARTAKLAGAPRVTVAGLDLHVRLGDRVARGQPLFTLHADSPGELDYALAYARRLPTLITLA